MERIRREEGLHFEIQLDGGVTLSNLSEVLEAGTDIVVAGSSIFKSEDITKVAKDFLSIMDAGRKNEIR